MPLKPRIDRNDQLDQRFFEISIKQSGFDAIFSVYLMFSSFINSTPSHQ